MTVLSGIALWCITGLLLCAALFLLRKPVVLLARLLLRFCAALAGLALLSPAAGSLGISLGINPVNALVLGLLGVPGFGLLLLIQWMLR